MIPSLITTPGAANANSFGTRAEADAYHATQYHPDAPWPDNISATATLGSTTNGKVVVTVDLQGTEGNSYTIAVIAGVGNNVPLSASVIGTDITVTLGTNSGGALDSTKNTAILVATVVNNLINVSAAYSGDGSDVVAPITRFSFSGGSYGEELKNPVLIMGSQLISNAFIWDGWVTNPGQSLAFPRNSLLSRDGFSYIPSNINPPEIKYASFEFARILLYEDRTIESDVIREGLQLLKAGPVMLQWRDRIYNRPEVIPDVAYNWIPPTWIEGFSSRSGQFSLKRA